VFQHVALLITLPQSCESATGSESARHASICRLCLTLRACRPSEEPTMAKSQKKSNKEVRKPKAEKVKTIAANSSTKNKTVDMVTIKS
jgi:hypothetical protein